MDNLPIPPEYQLLVAGLVGFFAVIGWAVTFVRSLKREQADSPGPDQLRMLGAALGDTQALDGISHELREIRALMQRHMDVDRTGDLAAAMNDVAAALRARQPARQPRR